MPVHRATKVVRAEPQALLEYLAQVVHVPTWVPWLIEAEPSEGETVQVTAELPTGDGPPQRVTADAAYGAGGDRAVAFRVPDAAVEGRITVTPHGDGAEVAIEVTTERTGGVDVPGSLEEALTHIAALTAGMGER